MPDGSPAPAGHNNPPAFDPEVLSALSAKTEEFLEVTQKWLELDKIETEEHAGQVTDQIDGLRGLFKKVDTARKDAKRPHDEAGKAVQAAFSPVLEKLKRAADALKPKLAAFAAAKAAREAEEQRKAQEEADRKAAEAEAARKAAEESGNIGAQVDAEEAAKAAEAAQKDAARPTKSNVKSATGAGRTMSLREVKEVEVTNINVLFMHYKEREEVAELLKRLATADVRAKDYDPEKPIPGVKVTTRSVMA